MLLIVAIFSSSVRHARAALYLCGVLPRTAIGCATAATPASSSGSPTNMIACFISMRNPNRTSCRIENVALALLFVSQGDERIDSRGSARRNYAGGNYDRTRCKNRDNQSHRILWTKTKKEGPQ
jgi:hypothetical protein